MVVIVGASERSGAKIIGADRNKASAQQPERNKLPEAGQLYTTKV